MARRRRRARAVLLVIALAVLAAAGVWAGRVWLPRWRSQPAEAVPQKSKPASPGAPKPVPKGLTSWVVQVAALSTPEAAQKLEVDLRNKGFHAFVEKVEGPTRPLWRVRVGPEVERTRADALATDVKKRTGLDAVVRKYRDG